MNDGARSSCATCARVTDLSARSSTCRSRSRKAASWQVLGADGAGRRQPRRRSRDSGRIQAGSLRFDGGDISRRKAWQIGAVGIVHAPEGRSVFGSLTVEENLTLDFAAASGRRACAEGLERAYELFPRLGERRRQGAGTLSGGEQRMLSLARVLVHPPRLLVVDELSLGLAPIVIDELYATLRQVNEAGTTLLISSSTSAMRCRSPTRSCCSNTAR